MKGFRILTVSVFQMNPLTISDSTGSSVRLLHDRDSIYGEMFRRQVEALKIREICTAPRSPWQNPYAERVIGSIRRECLDHMIVLGELHLRRILASYFDYYHGARTHLSLYKDTPERRLAQSQTVYTGRLAPAARRT
ncbi:MAG: integrase core domain-containing protein [Woeseia sp.]